MNIALVSITPLRYRKEATTITLLDLAKYLKNSGHRIFIVGKRKGDIPNYLVLDNIPIVRVPNIGAYKAVIKAIENKNNFKFDIIHSFSASPLFILSLLGLKFGRQLLHTFKSYPRDKYSKYFYWLSNFTDLTTVSSSVFKNRLNLLQEKKIKVVQSSINLQKFYPKDKTILKEKYEYSNNKVILYYGSMGKFKGPQVLISTLPQLVKEIPNLKLIVAPRYKQIDSIREQVRNLGLEKHVDFLVDDIIIEDYVNLADCVVLPYITMNGTEGNPSCMLEAMACRTPVVTSNFPELREIGEECVEFVEPNNIVNLTKKIINVLNTPEKEMIVKAQQRAQEFSIKKVGKNYLALYQQLISSN